MIAKDIMTTDLVWSNVDDPIKDVAVKMSETGVGSVLVLDTNTNHLAGIITDRDIVVRGVASNKNIDQIKCTEIMSTDVITADVYDEIDNVIDLMEDYQIKRIPVTENDEVVGIISLGDMSQTYVLEDEAGEVLNEITEKAKH